MNDQSLHMAALEVFHPGLSNQFQSGSAPTEPGSPLRRKNSTGPGPYLNYAINSSNTSGFEPFGTYGQQRARKPPPGVYTNIGGRRFHGDIANIPYPLPCDSKELARQSISHLIYQAVLGGLFAAPFEEFVSDSTESFTGVSRTKSKGALKSSKSKEPLAAERLKLPNKVLDVGCGAGLWSACAADEFRRRGKTGVKFVGLDIVPLVFPDDERDAPSSNASTSTVNSLVQVPTGGSEPGYTAQRRGRKNSKSTPSNMTAIEPAKTERSSIFKDDFDFTFVRHNLMEEELPFADNEFDFVFARDTSLCVPDISEFGENRLIREYLRVLRPGGVLEIQCSDFTLRSLSSPPATSFKNKIAVDGNIFIPHSGAYPITASSAPAFSSKNVSEEVVKWNENVTKILQARDLNPTPCVSMTPTLVGETVAPGSENSEHDGPLQLGRSISADAVTTLKSLRAPRKESGHLLGIETKRWAVPIGICPWELRQEEADKITKALKPDIPQPPMSATFPPGTGPARRPSLPRAKSVELLSPGPPPTTPLPGLPPPPAGGSVRLGPPGRKGSGSLRRSPSAAAPPAIISNEPEEPASNRFSILLPIHAPPGQAPLFTDPPQEVLTTEPVKLESIPEPTPPPVPPKNIPDQYAVLSENQLALREVAKLLFAQTVDAFEVAFRTFATESGLPPDEWDKDHRDLMQHLFGDKGAESTAAAARSSNEKIASGGECLEFGAWWGIKA